MYVDRGKPLREGAFPFTRRTLFPPLDKKNARDNAKGLRIPSERHIGVSWACDALASLNRGPDSQQQSHLDALPSKVSLDMNRQFHKSPLSRDLPSHGTLPLPSP